MAKRLLGRTFSAVSSNVILLFSVFGVNHSSSWICPSHIRQIIRLLKIRNEYFRFLRMVTRKSRTLRIKKTINLPKKHLEHRVRLMGCLNGSLSILQLGIFYYDTLYNFQLFLHRSDVYTFSLVFLAPKFYSSSVSGFELLEYED